MIDAKEVVEMARGGYDGPAYTLRGAAPYEMRVAFPAVSVRDTRTGHLVAHSCMRADFEASVAEFVEDYLPEGAQ